MTVKILMPQNIHNNDNQQDAPIKLHIGHKVEEENTKESMLKNGVRQVVASFVILVVLFLLMNSSAYYQISKTKIQQFFGTDKQSPLEVLIDPDINNTEVPLETTPDQGFQYQQIPKLNIEISPITDRIVIPRINQNVPIIQVSSQNLINRDWKALENDIQDALKVGVVHYPGTSLPGDDGNVVITGHSSYFPWDPGRFKDVFALLHDVELGDKILVYSNQKKYIYEVTDIQIVKPNNIEVLKQTPSEQLTLITCTPVGTNLKRLIVIAKPVVEIIDETDKVLR